LNAVLKYYRQKKGLIGFFLLTYFDKGLSFALPLSILFILRDKPLYALVEVAFSYATIAVVLAELGLSSYLFWGYKASLDKDEFVIKAQVFFGALVLAYSVLAILVFIGLNFYDPTFRMLFVLIATRTLFVFYTNFYSNIYRLQDRPSRIYLTTTSINLSSFVLLVVAYYFYKGNEIVYFFLPSMILVGTIGIGFLFKIERFGVRYFFAFQKSALTFSWPIILNVLLMSFINNYVKIYAYGHLSEQDMVQASYALRLGLIIQLSHAAYASYFSKSLFMDPSKKFNFSVFRQYSMVLSFSLCVVVGAILFTNYFLAPRIYIPLNIITALFIGYIIIWCYIGYLELYFGVMNANRSILVYSVVSSIAYISLLELGGELNLFHLALFMVVAALVNLVLVIIGLRRLNIFQTH
jgi:hypothetical protein